MEVVMCDTHVGLDYLELPFMSDAVNIFPRSRLEFVPTEQELKIIELARERCEASNVRFDYASVVNTLLVIREKNYGLGCNK
jgi:hypothetical protein